VASRDERRQSFRIAATARRLSSLAQSAVAARLTSSQFWTLLPVMTATSSAHNRLRQAQLLKRRWRNRPVVERERRHESQCVVIRGEVGDSQLSDDGTRYWSHGLIRFDRDGMLEGMIDPRACEGIVPLLSLSLRPTVGLGHASLVASRLGACQPSGRFVLESSLRRLDERVR
jgi:hypothetical protein